MRQFKICEIPSELQKYYAIKKRRGKILLSPVVFYFNNLTNIEFFSRLYHKGFSEIKLLHFVARIFTFLGEKLFRSPTKTF